MKKRTLSVIVPAYNEEANIRQTIDAILAAAKTTKVDTEIIAIDDSSKDHTLRLLRESARKIKNIRVVHNPKNRGLGYNVLEGIRLARKDFIMMIPGDNEVSHDAILTLFIRVRDTDKDLIIPYFSNSHIRPFFRRVISRLYVFIFNLLFGLKLRYYNGTVAYKSGIIKKLPIKNASFSYQSEIVVKLVKSGFTYETPGLTMQERLGGKSNSLSLKSLFPVIISTVKLWWLMNIVRWRFTP